MPALGSCWPDMGESVTHFPYDELRWTVWSQRLMVVCLAVVLLLAAALLAPYNPFGYEMPRAVFAVAFGLGCVALVIWTSALLRGVNCTLPMVKAPFGWMSLLVVFTLVTLRHILAFETGLLGFLAFRSSELRYAPAALAAYGALGMVRALVTAYVRHRAKQRESD